MVIHAELQIWTRSDLRGRVLIENLKKIQALPCLMNKSQEPPTGTRVPLVVEKSP